MGRVNVSRFQLGLILLVVLVVGLSYVFFVGTSHKLIHKGPNASFEGNYTEGNLTITHDGGDELRSDELAITVENPEGTDTTERIRRFGPGNVTVGDSVSACGLEGDETVEVVWRDSNTDDSGTLFRWSGAA